LDATDDLVLAEPDDRGETLSPAPAAAKTPACPRCGRPMLWLGSLGPDYNCRRSYSARAPP